VCVAQVNKQEEKSSGTGAEAARGCEDIVKYSQYSIEANRPRGQLLINKAVADGLFDGVTCGWGKVGRAGLM